MQYKHITLSISLEGLSPRKLVASMEIEGFLPLYSKLVTTYSNFVDQKDPFKSYKKISLKKDERKDEPRSLFIVRDEALSFAELFRHDKYPEIIFPIDDASNEERKRTWLCCWSRKDKNIDEAFDFFVTAVLKAIGCDKPLDEIIDSDTYSKTHNEIVNRLADYDLKTATLEEQKSTFEILSDNKIRDILIEFSKKRNILLSDFLEAKVDEEKEELERTLNFLSGQKILNKSLIVICSKTGQWWNMTIPSKKQLKEIEKSGVTCASCGAKINEERIDNLFKISEKGKRLISGSYWMSGQVVKILLKLGVRENDIFVGVTYNGEEIDIIAFYMTDILIFELKDREFGLGDAYKFHGKVSRLNEKSGGTIDPIIVTTKTIATEARKLLEEVPLQRRAPARHFIDELYVTSPAEYWFAEELTELEPMLKKLISSIIEQRISTRMNSISRKFPAMVLRKTLS